MGPGSSTLWRPRVRAQVLTGVPRCLPACSGAYRRAQVLTGATGVPRCLPACPGAYRRAQVPRLGKIMKIMGIGEIMKMMEVTEIMETLES